MTTIYYSTARGGGILSEQANAKLGAWIHIVEPDKQELKEISIKYKLDLDLLSDAIDPYEAPRIERNDGAVYVYTRYSLSNSDGNATDTMLIIHHPEYLITLLRTNTPLLGKLLSGAEPVVTTQKTKLMLLMLEEANASYRRYISSVTRQLFSVRSQLKQTDISNEVLIRFVDLEDDLNEFVGALQPQSALLRTLLNGKYIRLYEEDRDLVEDLSLGTSELIELAQSRVKTLANTRQAYDAIATSELNRTFRRLTSISIFLMIPTIIFSLYGMNVVLPLQGNSEAFWLLILLVFGISATIIYAFKRFRWI